MAALATLPNGAKLNGGAGGSLDLPSLASYTGTLTAAHTITATKIDVEARGTAISRTVSLR